MDCKFYECCKKKGCCDILGECVFGHKMIIDYHSAEPKVMLHMAKTVSAIVWGIFDKIKKNQPFNTEIQNVKRKKLGKPTKEIIFPCKEAPLFIDNNLTI